MKKIKNLALALIAFLVMQNLQAQNKPSWKELKDFHGVMSSTFHPAEEGNLVPLREQSTDLLAKAKAWKDSPIAEGFKPKETKKVLADLVAKCAETDKAVKAKKSDEDLTKLITQAHDLFHQIVKECREEEKEK